MRSLTPLRLDRIAVGDYVPAGKISAVVVDPENGGLFAGVERTEGHGVEIDLLRLTKGESKWDVDPITTFSSPVTAPFKLPSEAHEIVSLRYFADNQSICILLAGGDIGTMQLAGPDGAPTPVDIVGSIESGIKAAAWSPDDEQLVLVTGEDKVMCLTRMFDVVYEEPLRTDDFGAEQPINVGWGSKTTQFHGSLGKAAAQAALATPATSTVPPSLSHPTDDGLPRITFRGDAAYFSISSLDPYSAAPTYTRRQIRVYSRDPTPKLTATSEVLPGLEPAIAWRPAGNLISAIVRYGYEGGGDGREGRWDVAMLERNGLRHGGFELREATDDAKRGRIREMAWNCDSELLAVWVERIEGDVVQLWSMKNYHYYLKQEIHPHGEQRFNGLYWHPEDPLKLYLAGDDYIEARSWVWEAFSSRLPVPCDTASVAVVDGKKLLITPFRTQNVPPPMSSYHLHLPQTPVHVAFSQHEDAIAILFEDGVAQAWDLGTRIPVGGSGSRLRGGGKAAEPKLRLEVDTKAYGRPLQAVLAKEGNLAVLVQIDRVDGKQAAVVSSTADGALVETKLPGPAERILDMGDFVAVLESESGDLYKLGTTDPLLHMQSGPTAIQTSFAHDLVFSLSSNAQLSAYSLSNPECDRYKVAASVTSFTLTPDFVIYTTSAHNSFYASLDILRKAVQGEDVPAAALEWETRRVERGSFIVAACPSTMSLVLQMPRGNLETVYPRALVLAVVRQDVLNAEYRTALITCRKHRIDLNLLYDLDPEGFMSKLDRFVDQVHEVDHLNLFISSLNEEDASPIAYRDLQASPKSSSSKPNKVNSICDALRTRLEARDMVKYVESVMTAHVCKSPPDYEAALGVLLKLQVEHPEIVEDSVKYIIFLSDVNKLYDVALGMYNFHLVLLVAQYSQKDPKEYLPFLRELRALDKYEQRFRIDDHLERREKALKSLHAAGPSRFGEAAAYVNKHDLFIEALKLYKDDAEHMAVIYDLYGDHLYDQRDFRDAALAYELAKQSKKAIKSYEKGHAWRELFALALTEGVQGADLDNMCERVADHLASRGRPLEASQVYLEHGDNVDAAVDVLCRGLGFSEAKRVIAKYNRHDLMEEAFYPGLEESVEQYAEVFEEMDGQLDKEMRRLEELRVVRRDDPDTFYMIDPEPALDNVDVATNASTVATAFTRYTVAPTTVFSQTTRATGMTNMTSKTKRKPKRRAAGRKGTVDEYEYLLASIGRLVVRVDEKTDEVEPIFPHLLLAPGDIRQSGQDLQRAIKTLRNKLVDSIEAAWVDREAMMEGVSEGAGGGLVDVVRPTVKAWRGISLFD